MGRRTRRCFKRCTGASPKAQLATALVYSGGLKMVQAVSIVAGSSSALSALNFMCLSLWRSAPRQEDAIREIPVADAIFNTCLFDFLRSVQAAVISAVHRLGVPGALGCSLRSSRTSHRQVQGSYRLQSHVAMLNGAVVTGLLWTFIGLHQATGIRALLEAYLVVADVLHLRLLRRQHQTPNFARKSSSAASWKTLPPSWLSGRLRSRKWNRPGDPRQDRRTGADRIISIISTVSSDRAIAPFAAPRSVAQRVTFTKTSSNESASCSDFSRRPARRQGVRRGLNLSLNILVDASILWRKSIS